MIDTILFDLDGTIVDTNELIIASFLHALEGQTLEPFTREHIIPNMGKPLVEQMLMFTGRAEVDDLIRTYREFNVRMHDEMVQEFPYVKEVLEELHRSGIRLGVVTSKVRMTTEMALKLFDLRRFMGTLVTIDDVKEAKPSPEGIRLALKELGSEPERTLMVGDSSYDLLAARNAGVRSVGVAWSMKGEAYLKEFDPDYLIHDMRELLAIAGIKRDAP
ncbi:pyrophosphatase PpaX [Paenibacillus aurantius]|uniref:Pyrophosphatase PpaX n=1 Tax=Paenibacillus aurantius TaxID=2918900 RepID=A0AA96LC71_9BACL|nr:pyrophosphatase PpaX [Paenibacillus aurantius]WJH35740.1 pyrophosphatase PpaX [Paenibacillus sp. CC-CFT747]WNQ11032.1 pyrophosphatase PpaX [Paenibacillus aurantius]